MEPRCMELLLSWGQPSVQAGRRTSRLTIRPDTRPRRAANACLPWRLHIGKCLLHTIRARAGDQRETGRSIGRSGTHDDRHQAPNGTPANSMPVIIPANFSEQDVLQEEQAVGQQADRPRSNPGDLVDAPRRERAGATESEMDSSPAGVPARWPTLILIPAAAWGAAWAFTLGLLSAGYAALACAAAIAAAAFGSLAPSAGAMPGSFTAASSAAAVAAVDWVDVALRTAAGLAASSASGGAAGRAQVLAALQEACTGPLASWAVTALLPGLCALAGVCGTAAAAIRSGIPWLEMLAHLTAVTAGLGVLLVLAMPLRPYLAPLLPLLPRGRPSSDTLRALRAGGAVCMVAVLTSLQMQELMAPALTPSVRGAAAAAAASSPLLLQNQAVLYGVAAAVGDLVLPVCTAVVAARAAKALLAQRRSHGSTSSNAPDLERPATCADAVMPFPGGTGSAFDGSSFRAVKGLATSRLLLDVLLLLLLATGAMPGKVSAVRLLGMLWLLQTAAQL